MTIYERCAARLDALPLGPHQDGTCWRCGGEPDPGHAERAKRYAKRAVRPVALRPVCAACALGFLHLALLEDMAEDDRGAAR
jgi:hypothetical protein